MSEHALLLAIENMREESAFWDGLHNQFQNETLVFSAPPIAVL